MIIEQKNLEAWKPIPGYKAEASSLGRIRSFYGSKKGKIRKLQKGLKGKYQRVQLQRSMNSISVHRLVALAWHDNPYNLPVVRHLDDNGLNNRPENLKWDTQSNNIKYGKKGGNARHKPLVKRVIREAYEAGFSKLSISKYFKITDTTVRRIIQAA